MKRLAIATCLVTLSIAQTVLAHAPSSTPAGSGSQQASVEDEALGPDKWPTTVQATVADLLDALSTSDKDTIRRTSKEDLIQFHHGWGTGIRNHYGLWRGNKQLIEDACGKGCHPDDASMVIIEAVWTALQKPEGSTSDSGSRE